MTQLESGHLFAGRYRLVRWITTGGMGVVYEAEHAATEARVALKLLLPQVMDQQSARGKFQLEAKIAARARSEHIVQVLDAGFDEATQSPYLVMELLQGHTLAQEIEHRGALDSTFALDVLQQVARGLDAAHSCRDESGATKPIIHRDLKPENLFLTRRAGGSLLVKILDFGIAKVLNETRNMSQEIRGTPTYMAYEQLTAGALSPQTDVWALGLIAYHALTGRPYWRSAEDPDAGMHALFAEILTSPLVPASQRMQAQGLRTHLPASFDPWLATCLARDPRRRFASAGQAIQALARALGDQAAPYPLPSAPVQSAGSARVDWPIPPTASLRPKSLPALTHEAATAPRSSSGKMLLSVLLAAVIAAVGLGGAWLIEGRPTAKPDARWQLPSATTAEAPPVELEPNRPLPSQEETASVPASQEIMGKALASSVDAGVDPAPSRDAEAPEANAGGIEEPPRTPSPVAVSQPPPPVEKQPSPPVSVREAPKRAERRSYRVEPVVRPRAAQTERRESQEPSGPEPSPKSAFDEL